MNKDFSRFVFTFLSNSSQSEKMIYSNVELHFNEHFDEIRQRLFHTISFFLLLTTTAFFNIKTIVKILETPVSNIHFFQLSPGEYFVTTLFIAIYSGLLFSTPIILGQFLFFFQPALNKNEEKTVNWLLLSSILLFILGLLFSYFILTPAALNFFIQYGSEVVEPFWSFNQYFNFVSTLFFSTGVIFQIPIIQIILSIFKIVNPVLMLKFWRSILLLSSIISAIITPSANPVTQLLLTGALFLLYLFGSKIAIFLRDLQNY